MSDSCIEVRPSNPRSDTLSLSHTARSLSNYLLTEYIEVQQNWPPPGKESAHQCRRPQRRMGSVPGSGRSPGVGSGNPLQHSCLGNPMDRGAWWAKVHGVTKSQTRLSGWAHAHTKSPLLTHTSMCVSSVRLYSDVATMFKLQNSPTAVNGGSKGWGWRIE